MTITNITIIIRSAPYQSLNAQEALDMIMAAASLEQQVTVIFAEQGVFHLNGVHQAELIQSKPYIDTFKALPFYDVENLYVCQSSLERYNVALDNCPFDIEVKTASEIQGIIQANQQVMVF